MEATLSVKTIKPCQYFLVHFVYTVSRLFEIRRSVGPSGQKITRTDNTAKYAGPGVRQYFLLVYFVLHRKSEMQLVCRNEHGQLGIRFCFTQDVARYVVLRIPPLVHLCQICIYLNTHYQKK